MHVINIQENYTKDKGKIILEKSPKIYKHIDKKSQLVEHMKTECLNEPIFEFFSMKTNGKRLEFYCIYSKWFMYRKQQSRLLCL